jgi:hypothetical protein
MRPCATFDTTRTSRFIALAHFSIVLKWEKGMMWWRPLRALGRGKPCYHIMPNMLLKGGKRPSG